MNENLKLLAVYESLNKKIEAVLSNQPKDGIDGKDGKDGKDANSRELFTAIAALHAQLTEEIMKVQREAFSSQNSALADAFTPLTEALEPTPYKFRVHRDSRGYIETVDAIPTNTIEGIF